MVIWLSLLTWWHVAKVAWWHPSYAIPMKTLNNYSAKLRHGMAESIFWMLKVPKKAPDMVRHYLYWFMADRDVPVGVKNSAACAQSNIICNVLPFKVHLMP